MKGAAALAEVADGVVSVIRATRMLVCRQKTGPRILAVDKLQRSYHVKPTTAHNN